jgi:phage/plasmid-associated DNA primase
MEFDSVILFKNKFYNFDGKLLDGFDYNTTIYMDYEYKEVDSCNKIKSLFPYAFDNLTTFIFEAVTLRKQHRKFVYMEGKGGNGKSYF